MPAGTLYKGRAYIEATKAARLAGSQLRIISAGMGFISELDAIPPYSLTISVDHIDSIGKRVATKESFRPSRWWSALQSAGIGGVGLTKDIAQSRDSLFVLAVSPAYLGLIVDELRALKARDLERLRLIGPRREGEVPEGLRHIYMPYDARLDGNGSPIRGTESDFPQRAGWHFVNLLLRVQKANSPESHRKAVQQALEPWPHKETVFRTRLPELELRKSVRRVLREADGHWTLALRKLRDNLNIACEAKRFQRICEEILEKGEG